MKAMISMKISIGK
uniref:Uncharacterized protein n=1 Tax=Rhizophora mucronata TaxID=61149 RepID=A0A2P2LIC2_RHIMU